LIFYWKIRLSGVAEQGYTIVYGKSQIKVKYSFVKELFTTGAIA